MEVLRVFTNLCKSLSGDLKRYHGYVLGDRYVCHLGNPVRVEEVRYSFRKRTAVLVIDGSSIELEVDGVTIRAVPSRRHVMVDIFTDVLGFSDDAKVYEVEVKSVELLIGRDGKKRLTLLCIP